MYQIRKIRNQNAFQVKNVITGHIHSYHTSKRKALAQVRLLNTIDHKRGGMLKATDSPPSYQTATDVNYPVYMPAPESTRPPTYEEHRQRIREEQQRIREEEERRIREEEERRIKQENDARLQSLSEIFDVSIPIQQQKQVNKLQRLFSKSFPENTDYHYQRFLQYIHRLGLTELQVAYMNKEDKLRLILQTS